MSTIDLDKVTGTMLVTLQYRATDARSRPSLLGDQAASEALDRLREQGRSLGRLQNLAMSGDRYVVVLRARQLDDWAAAFLAQHPDATVLQLGCGLDSRAFRLSLPAGVHWYDVDLPEVIDLRRDLYGEHEHYHMIATSVTDPGWLDQVPATGSTLVIAEGLLMYLHPSDVKMLLTRLTDHFTGGELIFDGVADWIVRLPAWTLGPYQGFRMFWSVDDGTDVERLVPSVRHRETVQPLSRANEIPVQRYRRLYGLIGRLGWYRNAIRLFRYSFGPDGS
ncbi:MAG: class I SAM-dependent methyltransferase [Microlunatus sp.]|nr:class I SAM-dependent methyltransferase [Microlunatus sp.]